MLIEQIFPQVVGAKSSLQACLLQEAEAFPLSKQETDELIAHVPAQLLDCECFLDRMTGLWRYEFGLPYHVNDKKSLMWGTHMWVPVKNLFAALLCSSKRLPHDKRRIFLQRLADPVKHQELLCEMAPMIRAGMEVPADFEVAGFGAGNQTVDWVLGPLNGRTVLFDVKRRTADFIKQADHIAADNRLPGESAPPPDHDPALLFRSVETKLLPADPAVRLQGVWIVTDIKQEAELFSKAFEALDKMKVHFAVLGDWEHDVHVVVRRAEDRQFLLDLFKATESDRFTFNRDEIV